MTIDPKIIAMQAPSTQKALLRPEEEDEMWNSRPLPLKCKAEAVRDAKTWEELVGARPITFKEAQIEQGLRYRRGGLLARMRGEEELSSVDAEKRDKAINAFTRTRAMLVWGQVKQAFHDLLRYSGLREREEVKIEK